MKSGILGKPDQRTEERALRSDGITAQDGLSGASRYVGAYSQCAILPRYETDSLQRRNTQLQP
jgi:hypothetical protein